MNNTGFFQLLNDRVLNYKHVHVIFLFSELRLCKKWKVEGRSRTPPIRIVKFIYLYLPLYKIYDEAEKGLELSWKTRKKKLYSKNYSEICDNYFSIETYNIF